MIFTKQARKGPKGVWFAPGKDDISPEGYWDRKDYRVYKLCENYDGRVKGGISKTWRYVAKGLGLDEARALLAKLTARGADDPSNGQ